MNRVKTIIIKEGLQTKKKENQTPKKISTKKSIMK